MADLGNLYFGVHLKDYTDAEADKVKKKLENLSVSLKIDGNNITVANADAIKKQIEAAVKSVSIPSVSVDANAVKQQVDTAFKTATPQVSVTLLKGNLDKDIQNYLSSKTYDIKISISSQQAQSQIKNLGSVTITAKLKLDKKAAIDALKKFLQNSSVPIGVRMKSAKDLANDIRTKMQNTSIKVNIDANKNILTSNIKQALKNQTFKADLKLNIQTVDVQQAIRDAFAKAGLAYNTTASNVRAALISTRQQKADAYVDAQKALADLRRAQMASAQAAAQHKNAMQGVNDVASKQKSLMTQLAQKIADLYSVVRIGDFVANMVRIGGEFEQQKVALGTIVGDASKAGTLFERIKNLAVESPYKFGDLAAYSKQLAAFGIEYNELYDTLKRFGDISAGLGVDMQRIILAFGQVKSAEFLKGTELRQFTEAGIPLVSELARRYTELEGSLVSVGDVFDRISKKEVPFEDVRAVLWDLTNEGGRFYEMQAVLTDTLKGKLDKLVDSYEIFLSKIADSNYSIIGGTLDLLAEILKNWKEIEKAVKVAISAYGAYKAALISITAVQKIAHNVEAVYRLGRSMIFLGKAVNGVDAVFKMLKATLMRHPIGLIATAVSALVGTLALLIGEERNVAEEVDNLNAKLATELDLIEQQKSKAGDLASIMSSSKNSIQSRNRAYSGLLAIYPNLFVGMSQEQALLLSELDIRERIAEAAKKEAREKLQADLAVNRNRLSGLQTELEGFKIQKNWRISKGYGKENAENWFKEATEKLRGDIALVETAINNTEIELLKLDQVVSDSAARKGERWYKDAEAYVTSLGEKFKDLMPKDNEDRDSYFSRIGNAVSSLKNKIGELNPELESAKELLDGENGLNAEYKVTKHIYTKILGGKDEDFDKLLKERQDLEKKREKELKETGERAAKMFADGVKEGIDKAVRQWDLYKQLFELTGDKEFAMTAFSVTPIWDEAANQMYEEFEKAAESQGFTGAISFGISDALAKETFGELYDSWKEIKDRIEKNGIDLKVNTANAIKDTMSIEDKIKAVTNKMNVDLEEKDFLFGQDSIEYKNSFDSWQKQLQELKTDLWELSPAFKSVFKDTVGMSIGQIEKLKNETQSIIDAIGKGSKNEKTGLIDFTYKDKSYSTSEEGLNKLLELLEKLSSKSYTIGDNFKRLWSFIKGEEYGKQGKLKFKDVAGDLSSIASGAAEAAQSLSSMFDALGDDKTAMNLELAGNMLKGISDIGQGIAKKDPFAILGGVTGIITSIAQHHDKKLDRAIQKSQLEVKKLENAYKNLQTTIERQLGSITDEQASKMLDSLIMQRFELSKQYQAEDEKKKTDQSKLEDYKQQMAELQDQIEHFYEYLAKEQYGVDVKGWAEQIADALTDAFASGEDAAMAFDKTVSEILQGLMKEMVAMEVVMPAMESLKNYMFGSKGIFTKDSDKGINLSADEASGLAIELEKLKETIGSAEEIWDAVNKATGGLLDSTEKASGGLSGGIQSITEDTANLLGSYLNSMRGDVYMQRTLIEQLVNVSVPRMSVLAEAQLRELNQIVANTKRNADAADKIYDLVNRVVDKGSNKLKV